ncbi:hypothetical protein [Lelliottia amnigena]|uniref:hypothetical protein n=1 Tax=Lelliottia amnigena TaxID=61646 RepID=UPI001F118484|nr:hypothetical protein [Lelliottia amnigena]
MTFTKEQLIAAAHARIEYLEMMLTGEPEPLKERALAIELQLARMALAGMEAEPVAYIGERMLESLIDGARSCGRVWPAVTDEISGERRIPLYKDTQPLTTSGRADLENYRNAQQVVPGERPAYEVGTFGMITIKANGHSLDFDVSDFDFKAGVQCKQDGGFNWKKGLQGIINAIQEHCDSLHNERVAIKWDSENPPVATQEKANETPEIFSREAFYAILDELIEASPDRDYADIGSFAWDVIGTAAYEAACRAAMLQGADGKPELTVSYGPMPESNGKTNWTAILHRKGEGMLDGITIDRSEYPGRVLYAADRARYLIGEKPDRPFILDYDADKHSGYVAPCKAGGNSPVIPDCSCGTCRPVTFTDSRFVVCSECGNKRCPHANDHRNACTGSNDPGQEGSAYPAAPQQEVKP